MALTGRKIAVILVLVACLMFVIGLLIGHYAIEKRSKDDGEGGQSDHLLDTSCAGTSYSTDNEKYKNNYLQHCVADTCRVGNCHTEGLPRTYLAYHLNGETINIDGKLDDAAWEAVPWSETFMDIRGPAYPTPKFETKFKVRWDDDRMYIGAYMQETDFWGSITKDEDLVWTENAFEVYAVPDGSMHNYKEHQINVLNTTWDLRLKKAYMDVRCDNTTVVDSPWSSILEKATYTDGTINDPNAPKGTYWSAEWSFSFANLSQYTTRTSPTPQEEEAWFFIFARPEYAFKINATGQYEKDESKPTEWWSWQPMYTVNLHLPSRFGLVQFKKNLQNKAFHYDRWHIYNALFAVFEAQHKYKSVNNMFVTDLTLLDLAPKMLSSDCVTFKSVDVTGDNFIVAVESKLDASVPTGHIQADRKVWFA